MDRQSAIIATEDSGHACVSMGNYAFDPRVLESLLREASQRNETDFGRHSMPRMPGRQRVFAYDFMTNKVPSVKPYQEHGYRRDVGTLDALAAAQRDTLGSLRDLIFGIVTGPLARDATPRVRKSTGAQGLRHAPGSAEARPCS